MVVLAESERDMNRILEQISKAFQDYGMRINVEKT